MKFLFDQNLSYRLVDDLKEIYPGSVHVRRLSMEQADDGTIWEYARDYGYTIVTQDSDFSERSLLYGYPPKVVWLKCGNTSTGHILDLLKQHYAAMTEFHSNPAAGCLELY